MKKFSIYNSVIPITSESDLVYNSYSDFFIITKSAIRDFLKDTLYINEKYPDLFRTFVQTQCYVDKDISEVNRLFEMNKQVVEDTSSFSLMINPTLDCNCSCWYCYEKHTSDSHMGLDTLNRIYMLISKIVESNVKRLDISFFGGEPFLYYKNIVPEIIKFASKVCSVKNVNLSVFFTTNGTLITEQKLSEILFYVHPRFQITLDGSKKEHDSTRFLKNNKGSYELILKNIKLLLENKCNVILRINYTSKNLYSLYEIIEDIKDFPDSYKQLILVDLQQVWQDRKQQENLSAIKEVSHSFYQNGFKNVRRISLNGVMNSCYGDRINTAIVNYNGDIFKCSARDFSSKSREGYLNEKGDIIWEESYQHRLSLKFKNKSCQVCRIAPICGGGCSQSLLEREKSDMKDYCLFNKNPEKIDDIILERFKSYLIATQK